MIYIVVMKKYVVALLLLIGCMPAHCQSCEYCGKWRYSGFKYANHITADCQTLSHDFEYTDIQIGKNFFANTYSMDNTPHQINNVNIIKVSVDEYENVPAIIISKDNNVIQKLYIVAPNVIYMLLDGCRFYFNRE